MYTNTVAGLQLDVWNVVKHNPFAICGIKIAMWPILQITNTVANNESCVCGLLPVGRDLHGHTGTRPGNQERTNHDAALWHHVLLLIAEPRRLQTTLFRPNAKVQANGFVPPVYPGGVAWGWSHALHSVEKKCAQLIIHIMIVWYDMEHIVDGSVITSGAFHKVVLQHY